MARAEGEMLAWLDECGLGASSGIDPIPLVHRTGKRPGWKSILESRRLTGRTAEPHEGERLTTYLSPGAVVYDKGNIVLVLQPTHLAGRRGRYLPTDSGGLLRGHLSRDGVPVKDHAAGDLYDELVGPLPEWEPFTRRWALGVCGGWDGYRSGDLVLPPPHRLTRTDGGRGAWSVEVQVDGDVPLDPEKCSLVLEDRSLVDELPLEWLEVTTTAREGQLIRRVHELIEEVLP